MGYWRKRNHVDDGSNEIEALDVQFIRPEALGEPGARRFRIVVVINGRTVIAWMEKDQVRRLGELLLDILRRLPESLATEAESVDIVEPDDQTPEQFRAGRMELSFDEEDDRLIVIMHDIEVEDDDAPAALAFRLSRRQASQFSDEAEALVNAGRPPCPLCGRPMGPGPHVCEKQNGHLPHD
jgi:uncharacterized repeat protein (TIGR03847 family)